LSRSVCFVGGGAGALRGLPEGGSEGQIAILARELARRGNRVVLVAPGCLREFSAEGVNVVPGWRDDRRTPRGFRHFAVRMPSLRRTLIGLSPDAVYTRGYSMFAPSVASAAAATASGYLAALACDDDLRRMALSRKPLGFQRPGYGFLFRWLFIRRALGRASVVLAQNSHQAGRCLEMGFETRTVRNAFVPPPEAPVESETYDAAWVGHISPFKGFDRLLELLGGSGELKVAVVGGVQRGCPAQLMKRAFETPGLALLGELPRREACGVISSSRVLLNTSPSEGFPNAFLEAWYLGRPVVSLSADPDGLLSGESSLGRCGRGSLENTAAALEEILSDPETGRGMGARGRLYVAANHLLPQVADSLEELLDGFSRSG
jgi:glycosyltransferase involved in cell wall biosynthesis